MTLWEADLLALSVGEVTTLWSAAVAGTRSSATLLPAMCSSPRLARWRRCACRPGPVRAIIAALPKSGSHGARLGSQRRRTSRYRPSCALPPSLVLCLTPLVFSMFCVPAIALVKTLLPVESRPLFSRGLAGARPVKAPAAALRIPTYPEPNASAAP